MRCENELQLKSRPCPFNPQKYENNVCIAFSIYVFFYFQKSIIYTNIQTGDILQVLKYLKRSEVRLIKLYVNLPLITFIDGYALSIVFQILKFQKQRTYGLRGNARKHTQQSHILTHVSVDSELLHPQWPKNCRPVH